MAMEFDDLSTYIYISIKKCQNVSKKVILSGSVSLLKIKDATRKNTIFVLYKHMLIKLVKYVGNSFISN